MLLIIVRYDRWLKLLLLLRLRLVAFAPTPNTLCGARLRCAHRLRSTDELSPGVTVLRKSHPVRLHLQVVLPFHSHLRGVIERVELAEGKPFVRENRRPHGDVALQCLLECPSIRHSWTPNRA